MSNKNKAAKSRESKQRAKISNKNRQDLLSQNRYTMNGKYKTINKIQSDFLKMVTNKLYEATYYGTTS